jgi:hypothetical protein
VEKFGAGDLHVLITDYPESAAQIMHALIERLEPQELDGAQPQTAHMRGDRE